MSDKKFSVIIPATLAKSGEEGEWVVQGLATNSSVDQQGESIMAEGIDLTAVDAKRGILNWDHEKGPQSTIGKIDSYSRTPNGLFIKGTLFKKHEKAKAVYQIMDSLSESDMGRMGMSVEGVITERAGPGGKIIKKCRINAVALTMNPVNSETYASLVKSLTSPEEFEVDSQGTITEETPQVEPKMFTASETLALVSKALELTGAAATTLPADISGGDIFAQESLDTPKKKKSKKQETYEKSLNDILKNMQSLYPNLPEQTLLDAIKARLATKLNVIL